MPLLIFAVFFFGSRLFHMICIRMVSSSGKVNPEECHGLRLLEGNATSWIPASINHLIFESYLIDIFDYIIRMCYAAINIPELWRNYWNTCDTFTVLLPFLFPNDRQPSSICHKDLKVIHPDSGCSQVLK